MLPRPMLLTPPRAFLRTTQPLTLLLVLLLPAEG